MAVLARNGNLTRGGHHKHAVSLFVVPRILTHHSPMPFSKDEVYRRDGSAVSPGTRSMRKFPLTRNSCRRCRRTGATCDFVPRANAARPWSPGPYPAHTCTELWRGDVTSRIKQLEAAQARFEALVSQLQGGGLSDLQDGLKNGTVGLDLHFSPDGSDTHDSQHGSETTDSPPTQSSGVLQAVERLKRELPAHLASNPAWSPAVVGQLWES